MGSSAKAFGHSVGIAWDCQGWWRQRQATCAREDEGTRFHSTWRWWCCGGCWRRHMLRRRRYRRLHLQPCRSPPVAETCTQRDGTYTHTASTTSQRRAAHPSHSSLGAAASHANKVPTKRWAAKDEPQATRLQSLRRRVSGRPTVQRHRESRLLRPGLLSCKVVLLIRLCRLSSALDSTVRRNLVCLSCAVRLPSAPSRCLDSARNDALRRTSKTIPVRQICLAAAATASPRNSS